MADMPFDQRLKWAPELSVTLDSDEDNQLIGVLIHQPVMLLFKNQSNVSVFVSDNDDFTEDEGTTMVSGEEIIFDCRGNHGNAVNMGFPSGTSFFATSIGAGATGDVKISYIYAK